MEVKPHLAYQYMSMSERFVIWLAWLVPRWLAYWVFIRIATADYDGAPSERTVLDAAESWDERYLV